MLSDIFHLDRRLALANERLRGSSHTYPQVESLIHTLLLAYAQAHQLSPSSIIAAYDKFSRLFAGHLEHFRQHRQYPLEYAPPVAMDRITYDVSLLLSCLVNTARFRITEKLLQNLALHADKPDVLVVGCGAGIELEIIQQSAHDHHVTAYDTNLGQFVRKRFSGFDLREQNFDNSCPANSVDVVLAIEILEHVDNPTTLMEYISKVLKPGGICFCTTATDLPQFDHRFNFVDIPLFHRQLQTMGFSIQETEKFIQAYPFQGIESRNDWFTLRKNPSA